jgi:hypothetical protein
MIPMKPMKSMVYSNVIYHIIAICFSDGKHCFVIRFSYDTLMLVLLLILRHTLQ